MHALPAFPRETKQSRNVALANGLAPPAVSWFDVGPPACSKNSIAGPIRLMPWLPSLLAPSCPALSGCSFAAPIPPRSPLAFLHVPPALGENDVVHRLRLSIESSVRCRVGWRSAFEETLAFFQCLCSVPSHSSNPRPDPKQGTVNTDMGYIRLSTCIMPEPNQAACRPHAAAHAGRGKSRGSTQTLCALPATLLSDSSP